MPRPEAPRLDWTGLDWTRYEDQDPPGCNIASKMEYYTTCVLRTGELRPGVLASWRICCICQVFYTTLETNVQCCAGAQLKKNRGVPYRAERAVPPLRFQMHMH